MTIKGIVSPFYCSFVDEYLNFYKFLLDNPSKEYLTELFAEQAEQL